MTAPAPRLTARAVRVLDVADGVARVAVNGRAYEVTDYDLGVIRDVLRRAHEAMQQEGAS